MKYNTERYSYYQQGIVANPRYVDARIYILHNGTSTTYTQQNIKSFKIDSTPVNGKWFGFSYAQQLSVTFIDPTKKINIDRGDAIKVTLITKVKRNNAWFAVNAGYPTYYVDTANRDEKTGNITATGFDIMALANNYEFTVYDPPAEPGEGEEPTPDLGWSGTYQDLINRCQTLLLRARGILDSTGSVKASAEECAVGDGYYNSELFYILKSTGTDTWWYGGLDTIPGRPGIVGATNAVPDYTWYYKYKATTDSEPVSTLNVPDTGFSIRDMITAIAEANGRIAYVNSGNQILFRMIPETRSASALTTYNFIDAEEKIDKTRYFEFNSDAMCALKGITCTNELNDSLTVEDHAYVAGFYQQIYDNPLLTLIPNTDKATLLSLILNNIYRTVTPYTLNWRGDMACEIGDNMWVAQKDCKSSSSSWTSSTADVIHNCFYLSETLEYNGGVRCTNEWQFKYDPEAQVGSTNISQNIKSTRNVKAEVDKVKGEIRLIAESMGPTGSYTTKILQDAENVAITATSRTLIGVIGPTGAWEGNVPLLGPSGTIPAMQDDITTLQIGATGISSSVDQIITVLGPTGSWGTVFGPGDTLEHLASHAEQTAEGFETRVSRLEHAVGPTGAQGQEYSSKIRQSAEQVYAEVTGPTGAKAIFDMVNSPDGSNISLSADRINMTGQVKFLTPNDVGPTGSTAIYGGRIDAHTITAQEIDTTDLYLQSIQPPQGPTGSTGSVWVTASDDGIDVQALNHNTDDAYFTVYANKINLTSNDNPLNIIADQTQIQSNVQIGKTGSTGGVSNYRNLDVYGNLTVMKDFHLDSAFGTKDPLDSETPAEQRHPIDPYPQGKLYFQLSTNNSNLRVWFSDGATWYGTPWQV